MEIVLNNINSKNLTNINLTLEENEIFAIISDNDNSKNELIDIICCYEKPIFGKIITDNIECDFNSLAFFKKNIFCLKEDYKSMLFNIEIKEDIKYYLGKIDKDELNEMLNAFSLDINILKKCYLELSDSKYIKILIIISLICPQKIIIYNHPTLNLDSKSIEALVRQLKRLRRQNKIIIINSNNSNFLLETASKIIVINNRVIIDEGNKFDILSNNKLLKKTNINEPNIITAIKTIKKIKNIKLPNRDNINDLIKDIFRYAK